MTNTTKTTIFAALTAVLGTLSAMDELNSYRVWILVAQGIFTTLWGHYTQGTPKR